MNILPKTPANVPKSVIPPEIPGLHFLKFVINTGFEVLNTPISDAHESALLVATEQ